MMDETVVLSLEDVSYTYDGAEEPALRKLQLTVRGGERIAIIGPGGSGKSTLCRLMAGLLQASPGIGRLSGEARLEGRCGFVSQNPETGLVMEYVEDELAFGPENLRVPPEEIEGRIDDALAALGLPAGMRTERTDELSGGQQQRTAIAAVLTMQPGLFVFDDAAANLDAGGRERLADAMQRLHALGHTLITAAPRWEGAADAQRVVVLESGRIVADGPPEEVLARHKHLLQLLGCLPVAPEGLPPVPPAAPTVQVSGLRYAYPGSGRRILDNVKITCRAGDLAAIVGPNGTGKTTFGKLIAGLLPAPKGAIRLLGKDLADYSVQELSRTVGYVFQRPERQFVAHTVLEECVFGLRMRRLPDRAPRSEDTDAGLAVLKAYGLYEVRDAHPQSLPLTQQRLLNLACVLLLCPSIIVLDEPTAGLDYAAADRFMRHCADFAAQGGTALVITHDEYVIRNWTTSRITL